MRRNADHRHAGWGPLRWPSERRWIRAAEALVDRELARWIDPEGSGPDDSAEDGEVTRGDARELSDDRDAPGRTALATMRRVSVVGASGSGKSTFASLLADQLDVPYVELDALYWGPRWSPRPREGFVRDAERAIAGDAWVIDGNYSVLQQAVWARADTVVWLDPPPALVLASVYRRTLRYAVNRAELWPGTGNRQPWVDVLAPWTKSSIFRWSMHQLRRHPERYGDAMTDPANAHLTFHRLRSRQEATALVLRATLG